MARISVSTRRARPSAVTTASGSIRAIASVTSSRLGAVERSVVVVRDQRALAAERVVGAQLAAQLRVAHDVDRGEAGSLDLRERLGIGERHAGVDLLIDLAAQRERGVRIAAELLELLGAERLVELRHHPVRGALEQVHLRRLLHDLGYELHRARGAADHRDALSGEVVIPAPARRVERACRRTSRVPGCRAARAR